MTHNRHDTYAKALAELLAVRNTKIATELDRPISAKSVDFMMEVDEPSEVYHAFADELSHRAVHLEFYSSPPSLRDVMGCVHKVHESLRVELDDPSRTKRAPAMLILSSGSPEAALKRGGRLGMFAATEREHMYRIDGGVAGTDIWLMDTTRLRGPGTLAFRLFSNLDHINDNCLDLLMALRDAEDFATLRKGPVMELLMETAERENFNELRDLTARELREWALVKGERLGEAKGRAKGERKALLHVAQRMLPPAKCAGLEDIEDVEALEAELFRRLEE